MSINLKQSIQTLGELLGNGKTFEVPPFQRDYSWEKEEWEDLWLDILSIETEHEHFMGYIVLQETNTPKHFQIIDGQQRITTISLLILAAVKEFYDRGDNNRAEDLERLYISSKDILYQKNITKLKLNRNNRNIYSNHLVQLKIPSNKNVFSLPERKLINAFEYFYSKIKQYFNNKTYEELTNLISITVDTKLFFTTIVVQDDINAYKIFETLNARGVKLSTADLFKNYLFSIIFGDDTSSIIDEELKWQRINDKLGRTDITTYLRHFWNSRNENSERKSTLFKAIKKSINNDNIKALNLLTKLDDNVVIYSALDDPFNDIWNQDEENLLKELKLLRVTQCYPLLMTAKSKLDIHEFKKLLRDIVNITFRYNTIGGKDAKELEKVYNHASIDIINDRLIKAKDIFKQHLSKVYIIDDEFKNDFSNYILNTSRQNPLAKYILAKLEFQISNTTIDTTHKNISIEHILPENPSDEWIEIFKNSDIDKFIFRIGNLTLLETNKNKEIAREVFEIKQITYSKSQYLMTQNLDKYTDWSSSTIVKRQKEMSNIAATIWKINY